MKRWRRWPIARADLAWLALIIVGVATLLPWPALGELAVVVLVTVLVLAPLLRVSGLVAVWWRRDDRRYASVGVVLVLVCLLGMAVGVASG